MSVPGYSIGVQPVLWENKEEIYQSMRSMIDEEGCGICEQSGAIDYFWTSPYSRAAHTRCVKTIEPAEQKLEETIQQLFSGHDGYRHHNLAHMRAVEAVREQFKGASIKEFLDDKGIDVLKYLFDTVGVAAVKEYAKSLTSN